MSVDTMSTSICQTVDRVFADWKPENMTAGTFVRKRLFTVPLLLKAWTFSALDGGKIGDDAVLGELWRRDLFPLGRRHPS